MCWGGCGKEDSLFFLVVFQTHTYNIVGYVYTYTSMFDLYGKNIPYIDPKGTFFAIFTTINWAPNSCNIMEESYYYIGMD